MGRSNFINSSIVCRLKTSSQEQDAYGQRADLFLFLTLPPQESLNAHSEYSNSEGSGSVQHHINQYTIKEEIGRGSCGSVHIAIDQYGQKYV